MLKFCAKLLKIPHTTKSRETSRRNLGGMSGIVGFEPGVEDDYGRHLVGETFALAVAFLEAGGEHFAMGDDGGEPFVAHFDFHIGKFAAQTS